MSQAHGLVLYEEVGLLVGTVVTDSQKGHSAFVSRALTSSPREQCECVSFHHYRHRYPFLYRSRGTPMSHIAILRRDGLEVIIVQAIKGVFHLEDLDNVYDAPASFLRM